MILEFCNDVRPACEPCARVWNERDCCFGSRSIAKVVIDVVNLQEIRVVSLLYENLTILRTILAALIVPLTTKS